MRLYEFVDVEDNNAMAASIVAVSNQLKQHVEDGSIDPDNYTVDQLLDLFQNNDIILDVQDLYSMMEKPLLKSVISNIQGDKVIFKGNEPETGPVDDKDEGSKTVANMAKSAMKKDRSSAFKI
jgi:hypothetical protein|tara:strand:+ start:290 stop:658 length:369 start_codon:yes stop_codon:yes gene_type:complete